MTPPTTTRPAYVPAAAYELVIGGDTLRPAGGFDAVDPSTGKPWATVPEAGTTDVERAVRVARSAFRSWRRSKPADRQELLWRVADRIESERDRWPRLLATENGRPIREAIVGDVPAAIGIFRYFSGLARTLEGETIPVGDGASSVFTIREPLGVIAALIPWNSPLITVANKLAPALATGNTVVLKPSELASPSVLEFALATADLFPPGVVNVVTGFGPSVGSALVSNPDVAKVSFTGGPAAARSIMSAAAANLVPSLMELGGKSALIVCPDADLDAAVSDALTGIYMGNGEVCFASSRLLVHDAVHDEFVERFTSTAAQIRVGDAVDPDTQVGPLISSDHRARVLGRVEDASAEGAEVLVGGAPARLEGDLANGFYLAPTLLADPDGTSSAAREEIFGPVAVVERWRDEDDVLERANSTAYGLAAGVWTSDLARAHRFAQGLEAGIVWVNRWFDTPPGQPQGGIKRSGFGRELSAETLLEYSAAKAVNIGLSPERPSLWGEN
jgi:aldehyde dehydrogenase (NAD+)